MGLLLNNTYDANNNRVIQCSSGGDFSKYTGATYDPPNSVSPGGCIILQDVGPTVGLTGLGAGTIKMIGPDGLEVTLQNTLGIAGAYNATLQTIPQNGGTYTWTGSGGKDVGAFTATQTVSPLLTWTNPDVATTVNQSKGLTVTWTGGNPGSWVRIDGASVAPHIRGNAPVSVQFACLEHVEAGQFTVPSYILGALPVGTAASIEVANLIYFPLSAPGIDYATGLTDITYTTRSSIIATTT